MATSGSKQPPRIEPGVRGLDSLIEGGFIIGDVHILAGGPGTGKTIFSSHFAYNAISKLGKRAVYATFEESAEYFKRNAKQFGMDFSPYEKSGKIRILDLDTLRGKGLESNISLLLAALEEIEGEILVIDSLTALLMACETSFELRSFMKTLYRSVKNNGTTALMTVSTTSEGKLGPETFLVDSVMLLENWMDKFEFKTRFIVLKMRGTDHSRKYHSVILSPEGLSISKY
ncbi:MAG: AAA family ATPase [Thaumarchaeota archaeon]|nr:AAA family ATPase [Nitrososphaerota archaeon]